MDKEAKRNNISIFAGDSSTYGTWRTRVEILLNGKEFDGLLNPVQAKIENDVAVKKKWEADNRKALSFIIPALSDEQVDKVRGETTVVGLLKVLDDEYRAPTLTRTIALFRAIIDTILQEGNDASTHLATLNSLIYDLRALNPNFLSDQIAAALLMTSLPRGSWGHFLTTLTLVLDKDKEMFTYEKVRTLVRQELQQRTEADKVQVKDTALHISMKARGKDRGKGRKEEKGEDEVRKCFYCNKKGHYKRDCRKRKMDEQRKEVKGTSREQRTESANVARERKSEAQSESSDGDDDDDELALTVDAPSSSQGWIVDSGASCHMTGDKSLFLSYKEVAPREVAVANGRHLTGIARGKVRLTVRAGTETQVVMLRDVLHVPGLTYNLFSAVVVTDGGGRVEMTQDVCRIYTAKGKLAVEATRRRGSYRINQTASTEGSEQDFALRAEDAELWHNRLGHINGRRLSLLAEGQAKGLSIAGEIPKKFDCEACIKGKSHRKAVSKKPRPRAAEVFERIHTDVCGPMRVATHRGMRYFVSFIDDKSRHVYVNLLLSKGDVAKAFDKWVTLVEAQTGKKVLICHSDNGGEYTGHEFLEVLAKHGIEPERTAPHTPEHNGVAERMNRTLEEAVRSMLAHMDLPPQFWGEALMYAANIINAAPTSALQGMTPFQALTGSEPDLSRFRVFGCRALFLRHGDKGKLDSKVGEAIYLGPDKDSSGYRLWNTETKRVLVSRDVTFVEHEGPKPRISLTNTVDYCSPLSEIDSGIDTSQPVLPLPGDEEPAPAIADQPVVEDDTDAASQGSANQGSSHPPKISLTDTVTVDVSLRPPYADIDTPATPQTQAKTPATLQAQTKIVTPRTQTQTQTQTQAQTPGTPQSKPTSSVAKSSTKEAEGSLLPTPKVSSTDTGKLASISLRSPPYATTDTTATGRGKAKGKTREKAEDPIRKSSRLAEKPPPQPPPRATTVQPPLPKQEKPKVSSTNTEKFDFFAPPGPIPPHPYAGTDTRQYRTRGRKENAYIAHVEEPDPETWEEAMNSANAVEWRKAAEAEMETFEVKGTMTLVPLPAGRVAIGNKWVFRAKKDETGAVTRYKARLTAKGYSQKKGIDYEETYAPVVRLSGIRMLLAIAAWEGLEVEQLDVESAYLNGKLDHEIYMQQPPGFISKEHPDWVFRVDGSLYGLKQSGFIWNMEAHGAVTAFDFRRCVDPCIYIRQRNGVKILIALHVDDFLIASTPPNNKWFKAKLASRFATKEIGAAKFVVGIQVQQDAEGIAISQSTYVNNVLKEFGMENCYPRGLPMVAEKGKGGALPIDQSPPLEDPSKYRHLVGRLMYAMTGTRPDIAYAVGALARKNACPTEHDYEKAIGLLRYLKGTADAKIVFRHGQGTIPLTGYVDADWGGMDDRRSTCGYIFHLAGTPIAWCSKREPSVALSSTEAEYMGITAGTTEIMWLRQLLADLGHPQPCVTLHEDNRSAINLAHNPAHHFRTKHIDVRYHYVREVIKEGIVDLKWISSREQIADILTKPLPTAVFNQLLPLLGLYF